MINFFDFIMLFVLKILNIHIINKLSIFFFNVENFIQFLILIKQAVFN